MDGQERPALGDAVVFSGVQPSQRSQILVAPFEISKHTKHQPGYSRGSKSMATMLSVST